MTERFQLPTIRQAYTAVPSVPNTPGFGDMAGNNTLSPPLTGDGQKSSFSLLERKQKSGDESEREHWPSSPLPPEIVKENLVGLPDFVLSRVACV